MISKIEKYYPEIICVVLCLGLGILSGYSVKAADSVWYMTLKKPIFNPPSWIFSPVWTLLYVMMGVALGRLWKEKAKSTFLIILFGVQFFFNLIWSPFFFYLQRIDWAALDIGALWFSLIIFMIFARKKRLIFLLFLPYILWVTFAMILSFTIYKMNVI